MSSLGMVAIQADKEKYGRTEGLAVVLTISIVIIVLTMNRGGDRKVGVVD